MGRYCRAKTLVAVAILFAGGIVTAAPLPPNGVAAERPFLDENDAAMTRMMNGMARKPTGDIDRDFAEMMIPHHQGAIDMAQAELRHGRNEQLRRIAQEIVIEQLSEIAAMRLALGDPAPPSAAAPTQPTAAAPGPATAGKRANGAHDHPHLHQDHAP